MKAFPSTTQYFPNDIACEIDEGMDLRDYFAAKAMQAMFGNSNVKKFERSDLPMYAQVSYEVADAMMKAREQ